MHEWGNYKMKRQKKSAYDIRALIPFLIKPFIILIILILMVVIAKALKYHSPLSVSYVTDNIITSENMLPTDTKQAGTKKNLNSDKDDMYYSVNYPVIGNEAIDYVLDSDVKNIIDSFIKDYTPEKPEKHYRAYMNMDYESYYAGNHVLSVMYYIQYYSTSSARPVQKIHTHVFSLADGSRLTYSNTFSNGYNEFLSGRITDYLLEKFDIKDYKPDINSLDFTLSDRGITIYIEPGTAADEKYGCISVPVAAADIEPYMSFNPYTPEAPSPSSDVTAATPPSGEPAKLIAFTFDDGPSQIATEKILNVLEQYNCHATFFVVGNRLRGRESTVKRAYALGCEIGSHSFDHASLDNKKPKDIKQEFSKTNDILMDILGVKAPVVRTPYGSHTKKVLKAVNYPVILWNIDTLDWKTRNEVKSDKKSAKITAKKIIKTVSEGDIVLMHDLYEETAAAVEIAVPKLIKKGYRIVSVSELMEYNNIKLKPHKEYYNAKDN